MFGGFGEEPQAPNEDCKSWSEYLKLFALWMLVLALIKMIVTGGMDGFQDLMLALILYCGASSYSYCQAAFFVMIAFFQIIKCITVLGGAIQNKTELFSRKNALVTLTYLVSFGSYVLGKSLSRQAAT